jgi:hypothetical protein
VLIIVTGSVGSFKPGIAYEISRAFNNYDRYPVGNYIANIHALPIEVYDSEDSVVYKPSTPTSPVSAESLLYAADGGLTFIKSIDLLKSKTDPELTYYADQYHNMGPDLGILPIELEGSYSKFIEQYESRPFNVHVVSGMFSKNFIERVIGDLGVDNVHVVCIQRNPSIAYLIDTTPQASAEWFALDDMAGQAFTESVMNTVILKSVDEDFITHVNFEDIISAEQINVLGQTIELPQLVKHNEYLTEYEIDSIVPTSQFTAKLERLSRINTALKAFDTHTSIPQLPHDVFDILGYEPVDPEQVLSP